MIEIQETVSFEASHKISLSNYYESIIHTHIWNVKICILFKKLDDYGITVQFNELHEKIRNTINYFDRTFLNNLDEFANFDPTAEQVALLIFSKLSKQMNTSDCKIKKIDLWIKPERVISVTDQEVSW